MSFTTVVVYFSSREREVPEVLRCFARERGLQVLQTRTRAELVALVNRSFPACVVLDAEDDSSATKVCRTLKKDTFSAIVPIIFMTSAGDTTSALRGLEAGADEVLSESMDAREQVLRLGMTLKRADRDVSVNPTTRLPGTVQIERDIAERMRHDQHFAVCYADIDHFKEFNDRYGYNEGDRVILITSRIIRDIVKGLCPTAFIGHIGGDDFIFNVPLEAMNTCCEEVLEVFDQLLPYQYSPEDRERGFFFGKDRRGNVHRIPLMTLSIGVVTNQYRIFSHTARVSELASEMKAYAKTLPGSVYAADRRRDAELASDDRGSGNERNDATPDTPADGARAPDET